MSDERDKLIDALESALKKIKQEKDLKTAQNIAAQALRKIKRS